MACLIITPKIKELASHFPDESEASILTLVGIWIEDNKKTINEVPTEQELQNLINSLRNPNNQERVITYTPIGKTKQQYVIKRDIDGGYHIFNKEGKEVFKGDSKDRRRIFANLAVREKRAVVVTHNNKDYVVNTRGQIVSVTTGDLMKWGEENGDRKAVLGLAKTKFDSMKPNNSTQPAQQSTTQPTTEYTNHSGGAVGSDSYWGEIGEKYGVTSKHYHAQDYKTPTGNTPVSREDLLEADTHLLKANETLRRRFPASNEHTNNLLRRNWQQVKNADAVFAVSTIKGSIVEGGTGWAVQMAIDNGKPVYVFDQNTNKWYKYNAGTWVETGTPTLTKNFAGIGTRNLSESGKKAIEDVYKTTFEKESDTIQPTSEQNTVNEEDIRNFFEEASQSFSETFLFEEAPESSMEEDKYYAASETPKVTSVEAQEAVDLIFDPQVRRDRVMLLARLFSNRIDALLEEKKKELETLKQSAATPENYDKYQRQLEGLDRKYIIDLYSPAGIFNEVLKIFKMYVDSTEEERIQAEYDSINSKKGAAKYSEEQKREAARKKAEYKTAEYHKLVDNEEVWRALVEEACPILYFTEKLKIVLESRDVNYAEIVDDDPEDGNDFEDKLDGSAQEESYKDGWMTDYRHVSSQDSLSQAIRSFIMTVPKLNYQGKVEKDDLGFTRFLDATYVHATLIDKLRFMTRVEDMMPLLQSLTELKPWVKRIIKSLNNNEALFSQFYQDFRKDFVPYWIQKKIPRGDGTFIVQTIPINELTSVGHLIDEWRDNYENGNILSSGSIYTKTGEINKENAKKGLDQLGKLRNTFNAARTMQDKNALVQDEDTFETIMDFLGMVGINANPLTLKIALLNSQEVKGVNIEHPTSTLLKSLDVILSKTVKGDMDSIEDEHGILQRKDLINTFSGAYGNIANMLAEVTEDGIESSVHENDKQYYSHTSPNYLNKLIKNLKNVSNDPERFAKYLQDEFKAYAWFYKNDTWLNTWLKELESSEELRKGLNNKVLLNYDKAEYKDWDDLDYTLVLLNEYWAEPVHKGINFAWYYVPILSDSPSAEFIRFRKYLTGEEYDINGNELTYDEIILDKLVDVVAQEYNRMVVVSDRDRRRRSRDTSIEPITNYDIVRDKTTNKIIKKGGAEFKFFPELNYIKKDGKSFAEKLTELRDQPGFRDFIKDNLREIMEDNFERNYKEWHAMGLFEELPNGKYAHIPFKAQSQKDSKLLAQVNKAITMLDSSWDKKTKNLRDALKDSLPITTKEINNTLTAIKKALQEGVDSGALDKTSTEAIIKSLEYTNNSKDSLREYFYNSVLATSQIIQLTTTDLSFYKNAADFQKRFKEVHTPSIRLNTQATYKGERVGKDYEKTVYLKDELMTSKVISDITEIILQKHKEGIFDDYNTASILAKYGYTNYKGKNGKEYVHIGNVFVKTEKINMTDAQAYRSLSSYRAILVMSGQWTDDMERAYSNFKNGTWDSRDFDIIWQTKKPFLYTTIKKLVGYEKKEVPVIDEKTGEQKIGDDGIAQTKFIDDMDRPIYARVPVQHKNSEFLLLAIYGTVAASLSGNSRLRAINQFMEDHQIDVVQFESAVKVGLQGAVDLNGLNSEEEIYAKLEERTGLSKTSNVENPDVVHSIPFEDYGITTQTPEHHLDRVQLLGTQIRKLITADISDDAKIEINGETLTKKEWIKRYNELHTENILQAFLEVDEIFRDPKNVERELLSIVRGNPRYGDEMVKACTLDDDNNFTIPLFDPVQSVKIQTLLNSIIKNHVTKQMIKGGSLIQATSFGLREDLKIVFEGEGSNKGIKYFECYMPATSKKFFEPFIDPNTHQLDVNKLPDDLRKAIGYRVPTEDKYSMTPLFIKGFLPQQNGSAIMLPAEITTITGSDFDVDKMYIMLYEFEANYNEKRARRNYKKERDTADELFKNMMAPFSGNNVEKLSEDLNTTALATVDENPQVTVFEDEDEKDFQEWYKERKYRYRNREYPYRKVIYDSSKRAADNTPQARNNMIIDMMWGVLTNSDTAHKILNPGGFDYQKRGARIATILSSSTIEEIGQSLLNRGIDLKLGEKRLREDKARAIASYLFTTTLDVLDSLTDELGELINPLVPMTQIYFHQQNMTGAAMIGIYANHNANHAIMQHTKLRVSNDGSFVFNNKTRTLLNGIKNEKGEYISRNNAGYLAASVDNVKDPVLAALNQNSFTADATMLLSRLGYNPIEVSILLNQPIIKEMTREYFRKHKKGFSQATIIKQVINKYKGFAGIDPRIGTYEDVKNMGFKADALSLAGNIIKLPEGQKPDIEFYRSQFSVGLLFKQILKTADALGTVVKATRYDASKYAAGPTLADTEIKMEAFEDLRKLGEREHAPLEGTTVISQIEYNRGPNKLRNVEELRQELNSSPLPMIQAFYTLGIYETRNLLEAYFPQLSPSFTRVVRTLREMTKYNRLDVKTINSIYNDLLVYIMSSTSFFGSRQSSTPDEEGIYSIITAEDSRDYFINKFPAEFIKIKENNPDIAALGFIQQLTLSKAKDSNIPIIMFKNAGRLTSSIRERYMRDWASLLSMKNPEAAKLALNLFRYNYYRNGFAFGPSTFIHLAPVLLRLHIPEYVSKLRSILTKGGDDYSFFIDQYIYNHLDNRKLVPAMPEDTTVKFVNEEGDPKEVITFVINDEANTADKTVVKKNPSEDDSGMFEFVRYIGRRVRNEWVYYKLIEEDIIGGIATYSRIRPLGLRNNFLEYEYGKTAEEIQTVLEKNTPLIDDGSYSDNDDTDNSLAAEGDKISMEGTQRATEIASGIINNTNNEDRDMTSLPANENAIDAEEQEICK